MVTLNLSLRHCIIGKVELLTLELFDLGFSELIWASILTAVANENRTINFLHRVLDRGLTVWAQVLAFSDLVGTSLSNELRMRRSGTASCGFDVLYRPCRFNSRLFDALCAFQVLLGVAHSHIDVEDLGWFFC